MLFLILSLVLLIPAPFVHAKTASQSSQRPYMHFNPTAAAQARVSIKQFLELADRCRQSAQATDNKEAFTAFKKINAFYLQHRKQFKNSDALSDKDILALAEGARNALAESLGTVSKNAGVLTAQESLPDTIAVYNKAMPHLLTLTPTNTTVKRVLLFSLIETAFLIATTLLSYSPDKPKMQIPDIRKRLDEGLKINLVSTDFAKIIGLALAKTACRGVVNEYVRKGISSYTDRLLEGILPLIIASAVTMVLLSQSKYIRSSGDFLSKRGWQLLNLIVLSKAFLKTSHFLYKPFLFGSYAFPFVFNQTTKTLGNGGTTVLNAAANMALEGSLAGVIFNLVPRGVDKLLPRRTMALNPTHRRATIRKAVQDVLDSVVKQWNNQTFTVH